MQTIAIISQKGGTGKTTLALNLAVAAERDGRSSVIIDLDPQASAKAWHDSREAEAPIVVSAQAARLPEILETSKQHGAEFILIDTAPHSESSALAAARVADLVLIPCRPGILDLRAIASSADICALAKVNAAVILNSVPPKGSLTSEAEEAVRNYGLPTVPVQIGHRMAFVHSLTAGQAVLEFESTGKAVEEIKSLYKWACQHASMKA
jgi:chromosome partitioning protein